MVKTQENKADRMISLSVFCLDLQQQVLRLLVNLSCNVNNLDGLLEFKVCEAQLLLKPLILMSVGSSTSH